MSSSSRTLAAALACLVPLLIIVMQGPSVTATLVLGAAFPLYALYRLGTRAHWKPMILMGAALLPHAILAWWMPDPMHELRAHYTILAVIYGVPAGMYFACLAHANDEAPARLGLVLFCGMMVLVALYLTQLIGTHDFVQVTGDGYERHNLHDRIEYLGFFFTEDLTIGVVPFTIFAIAALVGIFHEVSRTTLALILAAAVVAVLVNFAVLTRTALACAGAAVVLILLVNARETFRSSIKRLVLMGCVVLAGVACLFIGPSEPVREEATLRARAMTERLNEAETDGRLDHWKEAIGIIADSPGGESRGSMKTHIWAHNVVLDTGLSTGAIGMLSIICALLVPILRMISVMRVRSMSASPLFHIMASQFLAVFLAMQISPPNLPYLIFAAFFTGYVYSLPHE